MALTPEQRHIVKVALSRSAKDSTRVKRSLLEALSVESGYRDLNYGDRDSTGPLQQRPSQGWGPDSDTAAQDIDQYLARARRLDRGFQGTAGNLAQAVQGSAYPDRYDERKGEAVSLIRKFGAGAATAASFAGGAQPAQAPPVDKRALVAALTDPAQQANPLALISAIKASRQAAPPQQVQAAPQRPGVVIEGKLDKHALGAVKIVKEALGTPYVWGGEHPGGFDCSGLVQYAWGKQGVNVPRTSQEQWHAGKAVSTAKLKPGDALFFHAGANGPEHEGMYVGGGRFIEAPHTGATVRVSKLADRKGDLVGARRFG